jgi:hypothetical protein
MVGVVEQRKVHVRSGKDLHRITAQTLEHRRNPHDTADPDGDPRIHWSCRALVHESVNRIEGAWKIPIGRVPECPNAVPGSQGNWTAGVVK